MLYDSKTLKSHLLLIFYVATKDGKQAHVMCFQKMETAHGTRSVILMQSLRLVASAFLHRAFSDNSKFQISKLRNEPAKIATFGTSQGENTSQIRTAVTRNNDIKQRLDKS